MDALVLTMKILMIKIVAIFAISGERRQEEWKLHFCKTLPFITEWHDFLWFIMPFSHETNIVTLEGHIRQHTERNGLCPKHSQSHLSGYKNSKRTNAWQAKGFLERTYYLGMKTLQQKATTNNQVKHHRITTEEQCNLSLSFFWLLRGL